MQYEDYYAKAEKAIDEAVARNPHGMDYVNLNIKTIKDMSSKVQADAADWILFKAKLGPKVPRRRLKRVIPPGALGKRDGIHVAAFQSFFRWGIETGLYPIVAFGEAIAKSCDEAVADHPLGCVLQDLGDLPAALDSLVTGNPPVTP